MLTELDHADESTLSGYGFVSDRTVKVHGFVVPVYIFQKKSFLTPGIEASIRIFLFRHPVKMQIETMVLFNLYGLSHQKINAQKRFVGVFHTLAEAMDFCGFPGAIQGAEQALLCTPEEAWIHA
jgi:hypothetical protein